MCKRTQDVKVEMEKIKSRKMEVFIMKVGIIGAGRTGKVQARNIFICIP
ncbi:hypothetical protein J2Z42_001504 [Clostridium algifaecis]|uniref:Uncharacterized protein n=1 Tax=Clostridium algifaecis TaxID=1472040 RepID=A0ABS4KS13_9CLOT|nr:hypothetical protein [Clostridium algifaecis]